MKDESVDRAFGEGAALVAGGSGGIGSEICLELARSGSNVVLTYRSSAEQAERVVEQIRAMGRQALALRVDLTDGEAVAGAVAQALASFGRLHSVVYAAGPALHMKFISELSAEEWMRVVQGDLGGCFNLVNATLAHVREAAGAYVAVITSAVERVPARDICSAAPKAAIEMLMRGIAKEEGRNGVRANCVGPGWIDAGLGHVVMRDELNDKQIQAIRSAIPLRRIGEAVDIANAVVFLLSSRAGYISGQSIAVDGGMQL